MICCKEQENKDLDEASGFIYWLFFPIDINIVFKDKVDAKYDKTMRTKKVWGCFLAPNTIVIDKTLSNRKILQVFFHEISHVYSFLTRTPEVMEYDINTPWNKRREELKACKEAELLAEMFKWWKTSNKSKYRREKNFAQAIDKWYAYQRSRKKWT